MQPRFIARSYRWLRLRLPYSWSRRLGQLAYLRKLVGGHADTRREFAEEPVIERLSVGHERIEGIGVGLSERVVEIPWVMRRLVDGHDERVLDIGTAFSPMIYKRLLVRQSHIVESADLAEMDIPGLNSRVADVRDLSYPDASFDVAICLSTLEHVGMDNAQYSIESGGGGDVQALRELGRVARRVLVTVPGGADRDMGWQRQYGPDTFRRVVSEAGLVIDRLDLFEHDPASGWAPTTEDSVEGRTYGQDAVAAAVSICAELSRR